MVYESTTPTKERRLIYEFMERNKNKGVVSLNKFKKYMSKKGLKAKYEGETKVASRGYGKKSDIYFYDIKNKRGTIVASIGLKHKKSPRIVWWEIK